MIWWIILGIVAFIAAVITAILLLPVYIIVRTDENGEIIIRYKLLGKEYGEHPDPNNPIIKAVKKTTGITALEGQGLRQNTQQGGVLFAAGETLRILKGLLVEVRDIFKYCTIKKLEINMVCSGEDAADAAVNYGKCCTVAYSIAGLLCSIMKSKKKSRQINIRCDFEGGEESLNYNVVIWVTVFRVIAALWRIAVKEAKHNFEVLEEADRQAAIQQRKNK